MSTWEKSLDDHRSRQEERIMHAAGGLLSDGGLSALNMRSLADSAGVSRPTLYKYFPDIDSVLVALADSFARHSEAELAAQLAQIDGADAKLRALVSGALHTEDDAHDTAALHWVLTAVSRGVLEAHADRMTGMIAEILLDGVHSGVFREDLEIELDARFVRGSINAIQESIAAGGDPAHIAAAAETTVFRALEKR
jgi:AcrR family transcriptional regulator